MTDIAAQTETGSASVTINAPISEVFAAVADVTRMGDWSPECVACRWVEGADEPAAGAKFAGDNVAKLGPITLKRWTTTSEVTDFEVDSVFEFSTEGFTTWRYEFAEADGGTVVTESFRYRPYEGKQAIIYRLVGRHKSMIKGAQATLNRIKAVLEA